MSWLLKQAEDILNRVDQQTNAAFHQNTPQNPPKYTQIEFTSDTPTYSPSIPLTQPVITPQPPPIRSTITPTRRTKKSDESDLIDYLNSPTPMTSNETKKPIRINNKSRTSSSSNSISEDLSTSIFEDNSDKKSLSLLQIEIQKLVEEKKQLDNELQTYKRQQIQYQHQIAESDALLRDLRSRENDSKEILSSKDSQIALLRSRLTESDSLLQTKTSQYEQLQIQYAHLLENSSNISSQSRSFHLEQDYERILQENERLTNENQQLIEQLKLTEKHLNDEHLQIYDQQQQQTNYAKNLVQQLEQEMNDYKLKAQSILQAKDKLIVKLKDIIQHRSSTPTISDQQTSYNENENLTSNDDSTIVDVSHMTNWSSIEYEEIKSENELFKQELQTRESTIHTLRHDLQEIELLNQQTEEQYQEQINQLNEQLKDEQSRSLLTEQDYQKLKKDLTINNEEFQRQKQILKRQIIEQEKEIERLRSQITSKTINQVNDDELEKRLQTLTESLIHKQAIIEALQTEKSSLTMQLERLEKRLDDYEMITANNSVKTPLPTSIPIEDHEHYENVRYRMPLLRETPYDVDLTKKVKRAANHLDQLGIRLTIFLRRYPAVRLGVLFYAIVLHLWTFIVLFTYTPESHSNTNSIHLNDKL